MANFNTTPTPLLRLDGASVSWALGIIDRTDICHHLAMWRRVDGYDPSKGGRPTNRHRPHHPRALPHSGPLWSTHALDHHDHAAGLARHHGQGSGTA